MAVGGRALAGLEASAPEELGRRWADRGGEGRFAVRTHALGVLVGEAEDALPDGRVQ